MIIVNNLIALLLILMALIVFCWGVYVIKTIYTNKLYYERYLYYPYVTYIFFLTLWILSNAYFQAATLVYFNSDLAAVIARIANVTAFLATLYAFILSCRIKNTNGTMLLWQLALVVTTTLYAVIVNLFADLAVTGVKIVDVGNFVISYGSYMMPFFVSAILLYALTFFNFWQVYRHSSRIKRKKSSYMVAGIVIFMLSTFFAHIIVPVIWQDFSLVWLPPVLAVSEVLFVGYALLHHRFFSWQYLASKGTSYVINTVIYLLGLILVVNLESNSVTTAILLLAMMALLLCYWRRSLLLITKLMNYVFYGNYLNKVDSILKLAAVFQQCHQTAIIKLSKLLNVRNIQLYASNSTIQPYFVNDALIKDEIDYQVQLNPIDTCQRLRTIQAYMISQQAGILFPIRNNNNESCHIFMASTKLNNQLFANEEIKAIDALLNQVSIYLCVNFALEQSFILAKLMAHELRNPMGQMQYQLKAIEDEIPAELITKTTQSIFKAIDGSRQAIQQSNQLIDAVLDGAQSKPMNYKQFQYISIADLTRVAINNYPYQSSKIKNKIHFNASNDFTIYVNKYLYECIISNLLDNAIYYFHSHPDSRINVYLQNNKLIFNDTGPGIQANKLPYIFNSSFTFNKTTGNGLGLSFCQSMMLNFMGSIECRSELGKFTEFVLNFPTVNSAVLKNNKRQQLVEAISEKLSSKRWIIIGDKPDWLAKWLLRANVQINSMSVDAALQIPNYQLYSLVIINITNDIQAIKSIRDKILTLPVIAYSTDHLSTVIKNTAMSLGAQAIVTKDACLHLLSNLQLYEQQDYIGKLSSWEGKKLLVVDDAKFNRMLVNAYLAKEEVTVLQATNGNEAISLIQQNSIDWVLMDIDLPDSDGYSVAKTIRSLGYSMPIITLSGYLDKKVQKKALAVGMNDCLSKPTSKTALITVMAKWQALPYYG